MDAAALSPTPRRSGLARERLPLLALGLLALVLGLGAGLVRLGLDLPLPWNRLALAHGPLMLLGFFGTVIALERAVALGVWWAYGAPLLAGLGSLALVLAGPAAPLYGVAAALLLGATWRLWQRQPEAHAAVLVLAAALQMLGSLAWAAGAALGDCLPTWCGFLVLTIAGERLELSRLRPRGAAATALGLLLCGVLAVVAVAALWNWPGLDLLLTPLFGATLFALALWLLRHDIARHTIKTHGLTRYIAACLLSGYAWLALGGLGWAWAEADLAPGQPAYDLALHALLLGFVFSMVFGHAPLIGPALLRVRLPFHPLQYLPLLLLHASLALRLAGSLLQELALRRAGAWGSVAAILLFVFLLIWRARSAAKTP